MLAEWIRPELSATILVLYNRRMVPYFLQRKHICGWTCPCLRGEAVFALGPAFLSHGPPGRGSAALRRDGHVASGRRTASSDHSRQLAWRPGVETMVTLSASAVPALTSLTLPGLLSGGQERCVPPEPGLLLPVTSLSCFPGAVETGKAGLPRHRRALRWPGQDVWSPSTRVRTSA